MSVRRWHLAAAVAALLAGPIVAAAATGTLAPLTALAAAAAVAALVAGLAAGGAGRRTAGLALCGAAGVSLATTAGVVAGGGAGVRSAAGLSTQVEAGAILVLTVVVARYAPLRHAAAAAGLAAAGLGMTVWRFASPGGEGVTLVGMAAWAAVGALAGVVGLHLRALDERRVRSIVEARREQRLHLAGDLHDFVAHDVSEMLAQAQAGQVVAAEHPRCRETFAKIDEAAQRALRSLDQTVQMLHGVSPRDDAPRDAPPGSGPALPDVAELADRFADASGVAAAVELGGLSGDDLRQLPHELSATLYRVAVEALTNVRRHAPAARTVRVEIGRRALPGGVAAIELSVENDGGGGPPGTPAAVSRRNGLGLATLSDRVQRLGGRFSAGPREPSGWRVTAAVPTASERRAAR